MKRIQTLKPVGLLRFIYALIVCTLIDATVGVGSAIAADERSKGHGRLRPRSAQCARQKYEGCARRIWSRRLRRRRHTHAKSAFIYATVLEGAIRSSVNDGPAVTYRAGQNFSEMPGDRHALVRMRARPNPRNCWPCSWSTRTRRN